MNYLRMSFPLQSNVPVGHEPPLLVGPVSLQVGESGVVDHRRDRLIDLPPQFVERRLSFRLQPRTAVLAAFKKTVDLPDSNLRSRPRHQVPPFGAPPGVDEA